MTPVLGHTTDLHMVVAENQSRRCGGMELRALECIEYYGRQKGFVICKDLYEDFMECKFNSVQVRSHVRTSTLHFHSHCLLTPKDTYLYLHPTAIIRMKFKCVEPVLMLSDCRFYHSSSQ